MRRLALVATLVLSAACSSGSPIIPANFRGGVAVAPFHGVNPEFPEAGIQPLLAVASFRGDELRIINPATDAPVASRNLAWPLAVPTVPRPQFLASGELGDNGADVLVIAAAEPRIQLLGTWLDGTTNYGVVTTLELETIAGRAAQIFGVAVARIPTGPATGTPPTAPVETGKAWVVVALSDPSVPGRGQLLVVEAARSTGGAIAFGTTVQVKPLPFVPNGLAVAPDNVRLYASTLDDIGAPGVRGVAEVDASGGFTAAWPVRALPSRGCGTIFVATAFVGERTQENFYTFGPPELRVYGGLDSACCGADQAISCGVATYDPARGGLAADPAPPSPAIWGVPTQTYRTPMVAAAQPIAFGIALPAQIRAAPGPTEPYGSQVCWSPADPTGQYPLCPSITEEAGQPPFNGSGYGQRFMLTTPSAGQLWTSVTGLLTTTDGLAYLQDLGRFGVVDDVDMVTVDATRVQPVNATSVGPVGPISDSPYFGFPAGTSAIGLWLTPAAGSGPPFVTNVGTELLKGITVWPGFTKDEHFRAAYQGVMPGFNLRKSVLGRSADGTLYLGIQEAAVPAVAGSLPATSYWVTGAIVAAPELGIHTLETNGAPADIGVFQLDEDPCTSTRPNWIPAGTTTPAYDSTKPPAPHETVILSLLAPDPLLYPGGAFRLGPATDAAMASEYACLQAWFDQPGHADRVLTAFKTTPATIYDYVRGSWVLAGGFVLAGDVVGYAGRPVVDLEYAFAWAEEDGLSGEALALARKARRFYYASAFPTKLYANYEGMTDPMQPGPVVGFRLGRYCPSYVVDCDPATSPPARGTAVDFYTVAGLSGTARRPTGASGGNFVTSFDKSTIPGQEYRGRVFYGTFVGDTLMMYPPGLDVYQTIYIR